MRNLRHFRLANLAVVAGMAVATAVLTGALLVGDSVRASLRELAVQRLGPIDYAMFSTQFFGEDIGQRLAGTGEFQERFKSAVPGVLVRGGASNESAGARTAGVQIAALRESEWLSVAPGRAVINGELADALAVKAAEASLLLSLPTADPTPREATLARRAREEVVSTPRVQVEQIVREPGVLSLFNLAGGQRVPRNAWLNLASLQNAVNQPRRANLLFVQGKDGRFGAEGAVLLNQLLRGVHRPDDYGLELLSPQPIDWGRLLLDGEVLSGDRLLPDLLAGLNAAELAQRRFREIARVSGLIFQGFPGAGKSTRQLQASSGLFYQVFRQHDPSNLLLTQAEEEVLRQELEVDRLAEALQRMRANSLLMQPLERPSPFAFPLLIERLREKLSTEKLRDRIERMLQDLERAADLPAASPAPKARRAGSRT